MRFVSSLLLGFVLLQGAVFAEETAPKKHKVVIQVNSDDPALHQMALGNALNMQKAWGMDNVEIEIVAFNKGLSLMAGDSSESKRIPNLVLQNIHFSMCKNTIDRATKQNNGVEPKLEEGVQVVPSGVARIVELQEQGYSYIRP
ncbi:MAG: hypothetical protein RIT27_1186 [Pseudomonadota bacterium]|jgi:intracellular sulfur oxidation DsrE/DsrF family protein